MAIIGFDDQIQRPEKEEKKLSAEDTFKLMKTIEEAKKNLYISPERRAKMEEGYKKVVVHDFGDEYHLTDEEREAQNNYYKSFAKLNKCKRKYRKINEFVDCARISMQCLQAVAENNTVYDTDEFIALALKGKIQINGWFYPKYNGRDKKQLSWEYISEFILSDTPSTELLKRKNLDDDIRDEEDIEEDLKTLFSEEELERILKIDDPDEVFKEEVHVIDLDEEDMSDFSNIAVYADKDETKDFLKLAPEVLIRLKEERREMKSNDHLNRFISDLRMDDIETIEKYDNKHKIFSDSDIPVFTGDITNDKDYHKYLKALKDYSETQIKVNYNGVMRTEEEIKEIKLKDALDSAGWNIRRLYDNQEREKKLQKAMKADKKREKQLKEQLTKVQERSKRRMGMDVDDVKSSGKKKKKKKNKKKSEDD